MIEIITQPLIDGTKYPSEIAVPFLRDPCAVKLAGQTVIDGNRSVYTLDDFSETDLSRRTVEHISAIRPLKRLDDVGLDQLTQNLKRETKRYAGGF